MMCDPWSFTHRQAEGAGAMGAILDYYPDDCGINLAIDKGLAKVGGHIDGHGMTISAAAREWLRVPWKILLVVSPPNIHQRKTLASTQYLAPRYPRC